MSSNELIVHKKNNTDDYRYLSLKKDEFIEIIAKAFYKLTNLKMIFSPIIEESLREYVDSEKQKKKILKQVDCCEIENISIKPKNNNNKNENKIENNLEENMIKIGEKDNYDLNLELDENPYKNALIGGGLAAGAIINGSLVIGLGISTTFIGLAFTGIGLIIAIPGFLGLGIYKIVSYVLEKNRKEFFEDFKSDKMKVERDVQALALSKIEKYFNKYISIEDKKIKLKYGESEKYINSIIDIYIEKDNNNLNSILLELNHKDIINKLKNDGKILSKNMPKIRVEIMKTILSCSYSGEEDIFNSCVPLFKEFIKIFGPSNIDKETEKKIDLYIEKILSIMRYILNEKVGIALKEFKLKKYKKSFETELMKKYEEKKVYDNITKKNFTTNCNDYIIEPIGKNAKYYGILCLFFKFTFLIQDIGSKKKVENFNQNKENIKKKILLATNLNFNKKKL